MRLFLLSLILWCQCAVAQFGGVQQPMFSMLTEASSPIPSGSLKLWLKPESLTGTNGSDIDVWLDSSPYNNHGITNSAGTGPKTLTNFFKGYSVANFYGGDTTTLIFTTNSGRALLRNVPGSTLYLILTACNNGSGWYPFWVKATDSTLRLGPNGGTGGMRFIGKSIDADGDQLGSFGFVPSDTNRFYLMNMTVSYTGRSWSMYTNGAESITQGSMGWTASNTSDTDTGVSQPNRLSNATHVGKIAELILYGTNHAAADRLLVESYLTNKYGAFTTW